MATNFQQPFDGALTANSRRRRDEQLVRWLVGLALAAVLLGLVALGAGTPVEHATPRVERSGVSSAPDRPAYDGRGKWTGY